MTQPLIPFSLDLRAILQLPQTRRSDLHDRLLQAKVSRRIRISCTSDPNSPLPWGCDFGNYQDRIDRRIDGAKLFGLIPTERAFAAIDNDSSILEFE